MQVGWLDINVEIIADGGIQTEESGKWLCYEEIHDSIKNERAGALKMSIRIDLMLLEGQQKGTLFVDINCQIEGIILTEDKHAGDNTFDTNRTLLDVGELVYDESIVLLIRNG